MPERRVATTGTPAAIASMSATGIPSIRPVGSQMEASTNTSARASSAATRSDVQAPRKVYARGQTERLGKLLDLGPLGPLADQHETKLRVSRSERGDCLQQIAMPLPRFERGDAEELGRRMVANVRLEAFDVDAAVHYVHTGARTQLSDQRRVVFGDGHDELGVGELGVEDCGPPEQVVGVGSEAER